jgi:hypothetical protein
MAVKPNAEQEELETAPDILDDEADPDDGLDDEDEQFAVPTSLLQAAGIFSDADWDELPAADIDAMMKKGQ